MVDREYIVGEEEVQASNIGEADFNVVSGVFAVHAIEGEQGSDALV